MSLVVDVGPERFERSSLRRYLNQGESDYATNLFPMYPLDHSKVRVDLLPKRWADPEATLMAFLESTYRAAADLSGWERGRLECAFGEPRRSRPL